MNDFIWAFNIPGFVELAEEFLSVNGAFADVLHGAGFDGLIMLSRMAPVAVVWHALGYERAIRLPGQMGNMLLSPAEVPRAAAQCEEAFQGLDRAEMVRRGMELSDGRMTDGRCWRILRLLPDGLRQASEHGKGLIARMRPLIPVVTIGRFLCISENHGTRATPHLGRASCALAREWAHGA